MSTSPLLPSLSWASQRISLQVLPSTAISWPASPSPPRWCPSEVHGLATSNVCFTSSTMLLISVHLLTSLLLARCFQWFDRGTVLHSLLFFFFSWIKVQFQLISKILFSTLCTVIQLNKRFNKVYYNTGCWLSRGSCCRQEADGLWFSEEQQFAGAKSSLNYFAGGAQTQ